MSTYRTAPGVTPMRIHVYPKRRPTFISDARVRALAKSAPPAPILEQLDFNLSYAEFLQLSSEQASASA